MVGSLDDDLAAERAALHEAIIDTLSERADDGTPRGHTSRCLMHWSRSWAVNAIRQSPAGRPKT